MCRKNKKTETNAQETKRAEKVRKNPWRFAFLGMAVLGGVDLLGTAVSGILYLLFANNLTAAGEAASVGVIGGADGPTAIFVTYTVSTGIAAVMQLLLPLMLVILGIWGYRWLSRCKKDPA